MKRVLLLAIALVLLVGGVVYLLVRPGGPSAPQGAAPTETSIEDAFDVDVEEIVAQDALDAEASDGTDADDAPDDATLTAEEAALGALDPQP